MRNNKYNVSNLLVRKKRVIIFYEVFKSCLVYMRNHVEHVYYFVSKKKKI